MVYSRSNSCTTDEHKFEGGIELFQKLYNMASSSVASKPCIFVYYASLLLPLLCLLRSDSFKVCRCLWSIYIIFKFLHCSFSQSCFSTKSLTLLMFHFLLKVAEENLVSLAGGRGAVPPPEFESPTILQNLFNVMD